jgi:cell shape-determining protein MreC
MSKRELIQEVTAVKAENETMKAEMAEMKALLQELLAKK